MESLIKIQHKDGIQVVDSRLVAQGLNINHKSLMETIRTYQKDLEDLGSLPFETAVKKREKGATTQTFCYLNELQCHFVVTLSRNTPEVVSFKKSLVIAFDQAKKEVKILEEVIRESDDFLAKKRAFYQKKGYSDAWIEKRLKSIEIRNELESIWRRHGISEARQFAILTNIISQNTFGLSTADHKKLKGLKSQNLRDHMTRTELIFLFLAEEATIEFVEQDQPQDLEAHKKTAEKGGQLASTHLKLYEKETGKKVVSAANFLPENKDKYLK